MPLYVSRAIPPSMRAGSLTGGAFSCAPSNRTALGTARRDAMALSLQG